MHILMKSDEEPPEIINESIYENGICKKEDILPVHEPKIGKVTLPTPILV